MSFLSILTGYLEMQAGAALDVFAGGAGGLGNMLIVAGAGQVISGVGSMIEGGHPVNGHATATRNPIQPWQICYGECRPKGSLVYIHQWGKDKQMTDMVFVVNAEPSQSVDELLFDQQRIQIDTSAVPTSAKAGYTIPWTPQAGSGTSFTPVQQTINITSLTRFNNVVTVVLPQDIPYLQSGDQFLNRDISADDAMNGTFEVAEIISRVPSGGTYILTFTFLCGGTDTTITSQGKTSTLWADYGRTVYMEVLLGNQTLGTTFAGMTAGTPWQGTGKLCTPASPQNAGGTQAPNPWTSNHSGQGKTLVFLRIQTDPKYYASGLPMISFHIHGKNDIYDPRGGGSTGYTNNAALCSADHLTNQTWGYKFAYGTNVPLTPLCDAADICDEDVPLARGGTEKRYACNGQFDLTMSRGQVRDDILTSCAGRIAEIGGQQFIHPGSWTGPGNAVDLTAMAAAPFNWRPTSTFRDRYNGAKGTYISPANKWQATDFPAYAQDVDHGYGGDANLAEDSGERRWLELHLPFTTSSSTAQRIAKIEMLRRRNGATGTFPLNMAGYQFAPLDVIQATVGPLGFTDVAMEVQKTRLKLDTRGGVPLLGTEIDAQRTDSSTYDWVTTEELTPQGYVQTSWPKAQITETVARPWSPGYVSPLAGDAVSGPGSFGIQPVYGTDAQGNATAFLQIKGTAPITTPDTAIAMPQLDCVGSDTGGSLAPGTYVIAVSAFDSGAASHANTDYLELAVVEVDGTGSGSITVDVVWGAGDDGGEIYIAKWTPDGYRFHYNQTLAPGAPSGTVTDFDESTHGGVDSLCDHLAATWREEIHAGVWANQIVSVAATTITIGGDGMTLDQWAGYTVSLLAKYSAAVEIPILNMPVASSTASSSGTFTLTIGPNALSDQLPDLTTLLDPLDLVVMRGNYTFTDDSFSDPNVANPYFPSGATGVEGGHVAVVLSGEDAGDVQTIKDVSTDLSGHSTIFNLSGQWKLTPVTGDIVVICSESEAPEVLSSRLQVRNSSVTGIRLRPNVQNLARQTWLFLVRAEDEDGVSGPDSLAPVREIYFFGGMSTLPLMMLSVDGTLAVNSDAAPAVYLPADRTPSGCAAYVKSAPVSADMNLSIWADSTLWMSLTIPAGSQQVIKTPADCAAAGPLPANTQLRLSIDQVGTTSTGSDLSLFLYR